MNAALHSLGRALALRDEIMIDRMMQDVVPIDSPTESLAIKAQTTEKQLSTEPDSLKKKDDKPIKCICIQKSEISMPADKPTKIMKLSNAILMDALSKPEINPHWQPKEKPTKFRKGRTAYKLEIY